MTNNEFSLVIFDIDGTLTEILPDIRAAKPKQNTPNQLGEQRPKPGVTGKLAALQEAGVQLAVATNRGGVAWGYNTAVEAHAMAKEAAELCGIPDAFVYVCPHHPKARGPRARREYAVECGCRKPQPGMLHQAMQTAGITPDDTLFVGDMASDQEAAAAARVSFAWADDYFEES